MKQKTIRQCVTLMCDVNVCIKCNNEGYKMLFLQRRVVILKNAQILDFYVSITFMSTYSLLITSFSYEKIKSYFPTKGCESDEFTFLELFYTCITQNNSFTKGITCSSIFSVVIHELTHQLQKCLS